MNDLKKWKVTSTTFTKNIGDIVSEIEKGYEGIGGIRLKPFYQRNYKFTVEKESSVIESLLLGIPIPMVHLSSDITQDIHVNNVIDGQHRLFSIYRFVKDEFRLTKPKLIPNIEEYKDLEGKKFSQLPKAIQNKILYQTSLEFQSTHVQDNPQLELEIFTRYNQGTNPLTPQEIRTVVYYCPFNAWVDNKLVPEFMDQEIYKKVYNIQGKRLANKKLHEHLFILYSIHKYGLLKGLNDSPMYADKVMKEAVLFNEQQFLEEKNKASNFFKKFTEFYVSLSNAAGIEYPFSRELLGQPRQNSDKFQTSLALAAVPIFDYIMDRGLPYEKEEDMKKIAKSVESGLLKAEFLNPGKVSTTNYKFQTNGLLKVKKEIALNFPLFIKPVI